MTDFESKHIIEALRSGVPSRAVGATFSEARPGIMRRIHEKMEQVTEHGESVGFLYKGDYGQGKTHMLNTIFSLATDAKMVVSYVSLGKETPLDKLYLLYHKVITNTYLPGAMQPGFQEIMDKLTESSPLSLEMLAYSARELETDRLYYLLRAYLGSQDEDEKQMFRADLEGDFVADALIKKSYRRVTGNIAKFRDKFSKRRHAMDYFCFMSHLFHQAGYDGWVILFDEVELIGRMGKKARARSYVEMQKFFNPLPGLERVFSVFALSASYESDVIVKKKEEANIASIFAEDPESLQAAENCIQTMMRSTELAPLTEDEIASVLTRIQEFHGKAYQWNPSVTPETLLKETKGSSNLLRTRLRCAIEFLDQLYLYGEAGQTRITELGRETYDVEEIPPLDELVDPDEE